MPEGIHIKEKKNETVGDPSVRGANPKLKILEIIISNVLMKATHMRFCYGNGFTCINTVRITTIRSPRNKKTEPAAAARLNWV